MQETQYVTSKDETNMHFRSSPCSITHMFYTIYREGKKGMRIIFLESNLALT